MSNEDLELTMQIMAMGYEEYRGRHRMEDLKILPLRQRLKTRKLRIRMQRVAFERMRDEPAGRG